MFLSLLFLALLLVSAVVSLVIYVNTKNDIFALLCAFATATCLIWGLIVAHWSIHILALFALLFLIKPVAVATVDSRSK